MYQYSSRFVGDWRIDDTSQLTSVYTFTAAGKLTLDQTVAGGRMLAPDWSLGYVAQGQLGARCGFDTSWHTTDDETLVIASTCNDGLDRDIVLGFQADAKLDGTPQDVTVISVGGATDWDHLPNAWQFTKCQATGCGL